MKFAWMYPLRINRSLKVHTRSLTANAPEKWWQRKTFAFPILGFGNFSGANCSTSELRGRVLLVDLRFACSVVCINK